MLLGRKPHDPAQIARMPQFRAHAIAATRAPAVLDRSGMPFHPEMNGNDEIGDCTAVALANSARAVAAAAGFILAPISTSSVIQFYSSSTGYVPGQSDTDQGGVMADIFAYQRLHGFDAGPAHQTLLEAEPIAVDPDDINALCLAAALCGSANLGVSLAVADQTDEVWDTNSPADRGDPTPGSWGDHDLLVWDYTGTEPGDVVRLATWGRLQPATWRWVLSRRAEAYALLWRQLQPAVEGIDYDQLRAEVDDFVYRRAA